MEKLYQDRDWLYARYWDDGLNLCEVGEAAFVSNTCIHRWMKHFGIPRRKYWDACNQRINHIQLTEEAKNVIDGGLLGDWSMAKNKHTAAYLTSGSKYLDFLSWASDRLDGFGVESLSTGIRHRLVGAGNGKTYDAYFYLSRSYREFLPIRERWYPQGKKIVPKDLSLSPTIVMEWLIGDGCLECHKRGRPAIVFSTHGFTNDDVDFLVALLLDVGILSNKTPKGAIRLGVNATEKLLSYIGPYPPEIYNIYGYKFDLSRRGTIEEWRKEHNAYPSDTLPVPLGERAMEATYNGRAAPCP